MSGPDFTANSGGITSTDDNIQPGTILLGGTVTAGNVVTATITIGTNAYPFQITASAGDALQTLVNAFIAAINANTTLAALGITANQGAPLIMAFSFLCRRLGNPLPTISASVSGGATVTADILSQPADILDAGPIWYLNRPAATKDGDCAGYLPFNGPNVTYALLIGEALGRLHIITAANNPAGGNLKRRLTIERGMVLYDEASVPAAGGDKGQGTLNAKGLYIDGVDVRQRDCFVAAMPASQSGIQDGVITKINFSVVGANVGVPYDTTNKRWTPTIGMVRLDLSLFTVPNYAFILKNGAPWRGSTRGEISAIDYANGTDYYEAGVLFTSGGPHTLDGQALYTWFEGQQI